MSAKSLSVASLASAVAGAIWVVSQNAGASPLPLSTADLQVAVGACEAHGSVQQVSCEIASDFCDGETPNECNSDTWHGGCTGVNTPRPEGSGTENHKEDNCTNTYDAGPCFHVDATGDCAQKQATSTGLTCGAKIGADGC
jgi:hypothetical protein